MTHIPKSEGDASSGLTSESGYGEDFYAALHKMPLGTVLDALPEAVYLTDKDGFITFYNQAAATLWGVSPLLGETQYCGAWKLFYLDGTPLPRNQCSMAIALEEQRPINGRKAIALRPNGTHIRFLAFPAPIFDSEGNLIGAVNMLVSLTHETSAEEPDVSFNAIVDSSDEAFIAKDLKGVIHNWNEGAQRLFGYTASEAVGRSVAMLEPMDRQNEEIDILRRIRRNEHVENHETIRRRKDGSLVEISQSVSPIKNNEGNIIGAAKIARDITLRRQREEQRSLLIREMDHRVKNLFALAKSVVSLSVHSATTPRELAAVVSARLNALARSNALCLRQSFNGEQPTTLHTLIQTIVAPYVESHYNRQSRVFVTGPDIATLGNTATNFALLLHELVTNSAKYGSLSLPGGSLEINCNETEDLFTIVWSERNGPPIDREPHIVGFGTRLAKATVVGLLAGNISRDWRREGLSITLTFSASLFRAP